VTNHNESLAYLALFYVLPLKAECLLDCDLVIVGVAYGVGAVTARSRKRKHLRS
jgi:hypothetical protein